MRQGYDPWDNENNFDALLTSYFIHKNPSRFCIQRWTGEFHSDRFRVTWEMDGDQHRVEFTVEERDSFKDKLYEALKQLEKK